VGKLLLEFIKTEKAAGGVLLLCTLFSLAVANSGVGSSYISFWHTPLLGEPISLWINDGLMAVFFLLVGLEIERELYVGELSDRRKARLPIAAALGGMLLPALIHLTFNVGTPTQAGVGIPMATDIAFALGVLSLLGDRVPVSLKVFLVAFAIMDDLGAIIVIALFYSGGLSTLHLAGSILISAVLFAFNRRKVQSLLLYLVSGVALWYFIHQSGIHSTITGVILAFLIPFGKGEASSPSSRLQHLLHYPVAFIVLPLFALANTSVVISSDWYLSLKESNSLGILLGLIVGKPLGISIFSMVAVRLGYCSLPANIQWKHIIAVSMLGGIGFTMSMFVALLAFEDAAILEQTKIAIFLASLVSGVMGYLSLKRILRH